MAKLFIANGTYQHKEFNYRLPEIATPRRLPIPAKVQVALDLDLEGRSLDYVIEQLQRFGGVEVTDINAITSAYSLVYMVARPIKTDDINAAAVKDQQVRQDIAGDQIERAALGMFENVSRTNPDKVQSTTVEVEQMEDTSDETKAGGVNFEATVSKKAGKRQERPRRG